MTLSSLERLLNKHGYALVCHEDSTHYSAFLAGNIFQGKIRAGASEVCAFSSFVLADITDEHVETFINYAKTLPARQPFDTSRPYHVFQGS
jgi:hypothetical protein